MCFLDPKRSNARNAGSSLPHLDRQSRLEDGLRAYNLPLAPPCPFRDSSYGSFSFLQPFKGWLIVGSFIEILST